MNHHHELIRALIAEIRRLRAENKELRSENESLQNALEWADRRTTRVYAEARRREAEYRAVLEDAYAREFDRYLQRERAFADYEQAQRQKDTIGMERALRRLRDL